MPRMTALQRTKRKRVRKLMTKLAKKRFGYSRIPLGIPEKKMIRLRYAETISLNPTVGGVASHYYIANGMYDPNITGTGHQPQYFDQWMTFYDHYTVVGAKITVTALNGSAAIQVPGAFGIILDDNSTFSYATTDEVIESRQCDNKRLLTAGSTADGRKLSVTQNFSSKRFFGTSRSSNIIAQEEYKGSASANPSEKAFFGVWYGSISGNDPASSPFMVEIEYTAMLTEPKYVATS